VDLTSCVMLRVVIHSREHGHADGCRNIPTEYSHLHVVLALRGSRVVAHGLIHCLVGRPEMSKGWRVRLNDGTDRNDLDPPDEAPETPTADPKPAPVQDPPAEPGRAPFIVIGVRRTGHLSESRAMNDAAKVRNVTGERKERRGFASMSPEKQREIASKGGRAAHQKGTAHEWTSEEARSAGRKGGQISRGGRGRLADDSSPSMRDEEIAAGMMPGAPEGFGGQQ